MSLKLVGLLERNKMLPLPESLSKADLEDGKKQFEDIQKHLGKRLTYLKQIYNKFDREQAFDWAKRNVLFPMEMLEPVLLEKNKSKMEKLKEKADDIAKKNKILKAKADKIVQEELKALKAQEVEADSSESSSSSSSDTENTKAKKEKLAKKIKALALKEKELRDKIRAKKTKFKQRLKKVKKLDKHHLSKVFPIVMQILAKKAKNAASHVHNSEDDALLEELDLVIEQTIPKTPQEAKIKRLERNLANAQKVIDKAATLGPRMMTLDKLKKEMAELALNFVLTQTQIPQAQQQMFDNLLKSESPQREPLQRLRAEFKKASKEQYEFKQTISAMKKPEGMTKKEFSAVLVKAYEKNIRLDLVSFEKRKDILNELVTWAIFNGFVDKAMHGAEIGSQLIRHSYEVLKEALKTNPYPLEDSEEILDVNKLIAKVLVACKMEVQDIQHALETREAISTRLEQLKTKTLAQQLKELQLSSAAASSSAAAPAAPAAANLAQQSESEDTSTDGED